MYPDTEFEKSTIDLWYAIQKPLFSPITSHNFSWPYVIFELKVIIFEGIPRFLRNLQRVKIKQRFLVYSLRSHTFNTLYKVRNKLKIFTERRDGIHVHHSKESSASQYNGQTSQMVPQSLCLQETRCYWDGGHVTHSREHVQRATSEVKPRRVCKIGMYC